MRRFVAEQNIRHFERMLEGEMDPSQTRLVKSLLAEAERELAEATREFEALEEATRLGDTGTRPIANDRHDQQGTQQAPGVGGR